MIKKYNFRARIFIDRSTPVLKLRSIKNPLPVEFLELNVPIIVKLQTTYKEWYNIEYFQDFEGSFNDKGEFFNDTYSGKDNQKKLLAVVEKEVEKDVTAFLEGDKTLLKKEKSIRFQIDDGREVYRPFSRYGNPKRAGKQIMPMNRKALLD